MGIDFAPFKIMKISSTDLLTQALNLKKSKMPSYSISALAQALNISPSFVYGIFNGKRILPVSQVGNISKALEMDQVAVERLKKALALELLQRKGIENKVQKNSPAVNNSIDSISEMPLNQFSLLEPWYRVALLDLVTLKNFKDDPEWIAQKLGIRKEEAEFAFKDLIKYGFIGFEDGKWKKIELKVRVPTAKATSQMKSFYSCMLNKAISELGKTDPRSFERRLIHGVTVATNARQIAIARQRLREMAYEIAEILSQGDCDQIYHINVQMIPLTTEES